MDVDVCDIVSGVIDAITGSSNSSIICKLFIDEEVRVIGKLLNQTKNFSNINFLIRQVFPMVMQTDRVWRVNAKIWKTQNTVTIIILFIGILQILIG